MKRPAARKPLRAGPAPALRREVQELRQRLAKVERKCRRCHGEEFAGEAIGFVRDQGERGTC